MKKAVSGIILTSLILTSILTLASDIQPVKASGTIYIRADGTLDPSTAPILNVGNVYYKFTADIYESIVVERGNIVVDGASYTVQGTGSGVGILVSNVDNVTVKNVIIKNFDEGIRLWCSSNNKIMSNKFGNVKEGVYIKYSSNNIIAENIVQNAQREGFGIYVVFSTNNKITGNTITGTGAGICLGQRGINVDCSNHNVTGNYLLNNFQGILSGADNTVIAKNNIIGSFGITVSGNLKNTVSENTISGVIYGGIQLSTTSYNNITDNEVLGSGGWYGIWLQSSSKNIIARNNVSGFSINGIRIEKLNVPPPYSSEPSMDNKIYHNNFMDNIPNVYLSDSINIWDDGYPSGGNYWGDYAGVDEKSGPNQDQPGSDGIGDTPYFIDANNRDRYPLMKPWTGMPSLAPPVASFSYSPHNPMVNERVTFDASSSYDPEGGRIVNYHWELYRITSDGAIIWPPMDIIEGSDKVIVSYSFGKGEYLIKLTVKDDEDQTATTSKTLKVWEKWSFVFITDLHIGGLYGKYLGWRYHSTDYDSAGWNDNGVGEETVATQNLGEIVQEINSHIEEYNIAFVVVGGDLTDSGEISEFNKAVEILNKLKVPWIPIMGNHDVWPYTSAENKAPEEQSDRYFNDIFVSKYQELSNLFQNWTKATVPVWNPETNPNHYSYFQNFAFDYKGYHLIFLDFNARDDAPSGKGVMAEGDLHNFTGGTWNWFTNHLREYVQKHPNSDENIILFAHHPFNEGIVSYMGFSHDELDGMRSFLRNYANNVWGEFAGHTHQNKDELWYEGILRVIETEAIVEKPIGRVVQVYYDGRIDYSVFLQKTAQAFSIAAHSPVDLKVTDPDGFIISKELNEIPGSLYLEEDLDEDGVLEDYIIISQRKIGDYSITVMPEYGANPTALYTLEVLGEDATIILAENVPISDIPSVPYLFSSAMLNIPPRTIFDVGEPKYVIEGVAYLTSATPIELVAEDNAGGSGIASTTYRIYNATYDSGWITYKEPFYLTGLSDGTYQIDYNSTDYAGNVEPTNTVTVILDNNGPLITLLNPPVGWALQDGVTFIVDVADARSGVSSVSISVREADGGEGRPVGFEDLPAIYDSTTGKWTLFFDTLQLPDGYYIIIVKAKDNLGNTCHITVQYSIRNWAVLELLPASENNKAGRTMPVKFALRVAASVDPNQPFVYNEDLTIIIYSKNDPNTILQISTFGDTARDYRINTISELYITNFQTLKTPTMYVVEIYRNGMLIGAFEFETVK
jgi:parallel beta-helix repeat protein